MKFISVEAVILLFLPVGMMEMIDEYRAVAKVSNEVSRIYGTECTVVIREDNAAREDIDKIYRILQALYKDERILRTIVNQDFEGYEKNAPYRSNVHRCSKMLHIIYGSDHRVLPQLIRMMDRVKITGPVWITFVHNTTSIDSYFRNAPIPFDAVFIIATIHEVHVSLEQLYRVSLDHPVRTTFFGNWSEDGGMNVSRDIYPFRRRSDMEGKTFRVSTKEMWPMSNMKVDEEGVLRGVEGYFGDLWRDLQGRLNFSTVYVKPREDAIGTWNGTEWNGLIGMILRGEIDAAVSALSVTPDKMTVIDFVRPLFMTRYQLFYKPAGFLVPWDAILKPFGKDVWLMILLWTALFSLVLASGHFLGLKYGVEAEETISEYSSYHCIFAVLSAFIQQGNSLIPKSLSCRLMLFVAHLFSTITVIIYGGMLTSTITVKKQLKPFNSLESFIADGTYSVELIPGSDSLTYFSTSSDPVHQVIYQKFISKLSDDDLPKSISEALERVCRGKKISHLGEFDVTWALAKALAESTGCPIIYLDTPMTPVYLSIGIAKDNQYKSTFDYQLGHMAYSGVLRRYQSGNFPVYGGLLQITAFQPLEGKQMVQIYTAFLIGVILSVLVLLLELVYKKLSCTYKNIIRPDVLLRK